MKAFKTTLIFFALGMFTFSCGDSKADHSGDANQEETHEDADHNHDNHMHEHDGEMHSHDGEEAHTHDSQDGDEMAYHCPMNCEGDKSYAEAGTCPKCNMDLTAMDDDNE